MKRLVSAIILTGAALSLIGCPIGGENEKHSFHVYYFGEGNTSGDVPVDSNTYSSGDTATVLDAGTLQKDGYTFRGWVRSTDTGYLYLAGDTFSINYGSVRFYAAWSNTQPFLYEDDEIVPGGVTITGYTADPRFYNESLRAVSAGGEALPASAAMADYYYYDYDRSVTIPDSIDGKPVTGIAEGAFSSYYISECNLPSGLIHIDANAFLNHAISAIELPDSLVTLGEAAFRSNRISSLKIGASLTSIPALAFESNSLSALTLPPNITKVEQTAFYSNPITEITIGDGVEIEGSGTALGVYGQGFKTLYEEKGRAAGTYLVRNSEWKKVIFDDGSAQ